MKDTAQLKLKDGVRQWRTLWIKNQTSVISKKRFDSLFFDKIVVRWAYDLTVV